MTPVALYQYVVRCTLLFLGGISIWMAIFLVLVWLLRYEPVQVTPLPSSRRKRIAWIVLSAAIGVLTMVFALNMSFAEYTAVEMAIYGCVAALEALLFLGVVRTSSDELRRAVHLRRHQLRQQTHDQPRAIGNQ